LVLLNLFSVSSLATTTIRDEFGRTIETSARGSYDYVDHQLIVFLRPGTISVNINVDEPEPVDRYRDDVEFVEQIARIGVQSIQCLFLDQADDEAQVFVLYFNKQYDITRASDVLESYDDVLLVEYNYVVRIGDVSTELLPKGKEDPMWGFQWNLKDGDLGIGCETAWSCTTGDSNIVIGIVEKGIKSNHTDLSNVFTDGFRIVYDATAPSLYRYIPGMVSSNDNHGTPIAGIIGARNNDIYIRGIAGGNDTQRGCSLYGILITTGLVPDKIPVSGLVRAYQYAAEDCDIISQSASFPWYSEALRVGVWKVFQEGVSFVSGKGEHSGLSSKQYDDFAFPADYDYSKVVCVSGYSIDDTTLCYRNCYGLYCTDYGKGLDLLAPADSFRTLAGDGTSTTFGAVSGAVPHISGAIGLLRSYFNNSLNPEDYEWLLKLTAFDYNPKTDGDCRSWDEWNGHGNVSIDSTFNYIDQENFVIDEYSVTGATVVDSLFSSPVSYTLTKGTLIGDYSVMPCSLTATISFDYSYDEEPFAWGMCHDVTGISAANPNFLAPYCKVESSDENSCVVSSYLFRVYYSGFAWWYPVSPESVVLKCKVAGVHSQQQVTDRRTTYSSPDDRKIRVAYQAIGVVISFAARSSVPVVSVYDIKGRRLFETKLERGSSGISHVFWPGEDSSGRSLPSGVYLIGILDSGERYHKKITIIR